MKKLYLFIATLIFVLPLNVFADSIDRFITDINVNIDGSIDIKEIITLEGKYNGLLREITYKNSEALPFDGTKLSFEGSDIYNGNGITNLRVFSVENNTNFIHLNKGDEFREVSSANTKDTGVFIKETTANGYNLKIFNPSFNNNSFYLEYTINDVVINHLDISEIGWNLFNKNNTEDINYYDATIHLPKEDAGMRIWGHGPLDGTIERVDNKTITVTYNNLYKNQAVDFRMIFANNIVNSPKKTKVNALKYIMEVEKERADSANAIREKLKNERTLSIGLTAIWALLVIGIIIYIYNKYDKEFKKTFFNEYHRSIPEDLEVSELEYLIDKNVTDKSFQATILEIIRKRVLTVNPLDDKKNYTLVYDSTKESSLNEREKIILDLLINDIGDSKQVTLKEIKTYGNKISNANNYTSKFEQWQNSSMMLANKKEYYLDNESIRIKAVLFSLLGIILLFFDIKANDGRCAIIILLIGFISVIYYMTFTKRSINGNLSYQKWMGFKKFLKDFGRFNEKELPEVILWEKLLVYAYVLGVSKELQKTMAIKIKEYNLDTTDSFIPYYLLNNHLYNSIDSSVTTLRTASKTAIINSKSSSTEGFGGGMSSGGGSFGGGGSVGRF